MLSVAFVCLVQDLAVTMVERPPPSWPASAGELSSPGTGSPQPGAGIDMGELCPLSLFPYPPTSLFFC